LSVPKHILVIRLSAPGDVAMTVPVLHSFQKAYPSIKLTILTNARLAPLFLGLNASLFFAETKTVHKGFGGLFRLFRQLNAASKDLPFDAVADLHNVLRSQIIRNLYRLKGVKAAFIDKGRAGKKELTRKENKVLQQLPTSFERYRDVFKKIGLPFLFDFTSIFPGKPFLKSNITGLTGEKKEKWIGVAPFAAYKEKMYPLEKMEAVIEQLQLISNGKLIFFGSPSDAEVLGNWEKKFSGTVNVAGRLSLSDELLLIANLDVMVSMDSANMHFASLVNVPVVSIWGATHPYAGFLGWNQQMENTVQAQLGCRPCSVFGNKPCYRGDWACMNLILPFTIAGKINLIVDEKG
jgi:ADP-heptose:LPS heptosyltransferase